MPPKTIASVFLCLVLNVLTVFSQGAWTLNQCIAYALEHNLGQENQHYSTMIEKEQYNQAKRDMLPEISVGLPSYSVSYGRRVDPITNTIVDTRYVSGISGSLSSSIVLFESFKKWNTLKFKKIQFESSKEAAMQYKYDLAFKIMNSFNDVLFYEGALTIVKEQLATDSLNYKRIEKEVALGIKAKSDLYEMQATISSGELEVQQADNRLQEAKLSLLQEMNLEQDDIALVVPLEDEVPTGSSLDVADADQIFSNAQAFLPSLQIKENAVEAAKKNRAITRANFFPKISFGAGIYSGYSPNRLDASGEEIAFWDQIKTNANKYISLSLYVPIFGNGRNWSASKIAKINQLKSEVELKQEQQRVEKEIQQLLQKNKALLAEASFNDKKVQQKALSLEIAQKKFKNGLMTLYDLQTANNELIKAKIDQLQMRIQFSIQKKTLDFYNGSFRLPESTN